MKPCMKLIRVNFITSKKELSQLTFVETLHHFQQSKQNYSFGARYSGLQEPPKEIFQRKTVCSCANCICGAYIYLFFSPFFCLQSHKCT